MQPRHSFVLLFSCLMTRRANRSADILSVRSNAPDPQPNHKAQGKTATNTVYFASRRLRRAPVWSTLSLTNRSRTDSPKPIRCRLCRSAKILRKKGLYAGIPNTRRCQKGQRKASLRISASIGPGMTAKKLDNVFILSILGGDQGETCPRNNTGALAPESRLFPFRFNNKFLSALL